MTNMTDKQRELAAKAREAMAEYMTHMRGNVIPKAQAIMYERRKRAAHVDHAVLR